MYETKLEVYNPNCFSICDKSSMENGTCTRTMPSAPATSLRGASMYVGCMCDLEQMMGGLNGGWGVEVVGSRGAGGEWMGGDMGVEAAGKKGLGLRGQEGKWMSGDCCVGLKSGLAVVVWVDVEALSESIGWGLISRSKSEDEALGKEGDL